MTKPRYGSMYKWPLSKVIPWQKQREIKARLSSLGWTNKTFEEVGQLYITYSIYWETIPWANIVDSDDIWFDWDSGKCSLWEQCFCKQLWHWNFWVIINWADFNGKNFVTCRITVFILLNASGWGWGILFRAKSVVWGRGLEWILFRASSVVYQPLPNSSVCYSDKQY